MARRPAPMPSRCWARPAAAKACWRWIRTMRWCLRKARPTDREDRWFAKLGSHVADILHEAGVPYCKGGVMAKNPQWRGSVATWRERIAHWIGRSRPDDLLAVDIFFDMLRRARRRRPDRRDLARGLRRGQGPGRPSPSCWPTRAGSIEPGLHVCSAASAPSRAASISRNPGLFGIVSAARALAICHHVVERSTPARLAGHQGARYRRRRRSRSASGGAGDVPGPHRGAAGPGSSRQGMLAVQCR